jgi:hypothetical protein
VLKRTATQIDALLKRSGVADADVDTGAPPRPEVWTLVEW